MKPETPLAVTLWRTSTDKQDNSIAVQERRTAAYLEMRSLASPPDLTFADDDTSGRIPFAERAHGRRILHLLEAGWHGQPVDHLIVTKVDRLGRKASDLLRLLEWMVERKKVLHVIDFLGEPVTSQGIVGKVMFGMCALFAEMEVERIRERITDVFAEKREQGLIIGGTPAYGSTYVLPDGSPATPFESEETKNGALRTRMRWPEGTRLAVNEAELTWLRQMAEWRAFGWAFNRIAKELNARGCPTKAGKLGGWQCGNVKKVLESKHTQRLLTQPTTTEAQAA